MLLSLKLTLNFSIFYFLTHQFDIYYFQVATAIEDLIEEHQRIPGSILHALIERIREMPKKKTKQTTHTNGTCQNGIKKTEKEDSLSDKCESDKAKVS